jgi:3-oxoadipate enol-lactonase
MTRPPVLLLHPLGSHGGFWDSAGGRLGADRVLAPDLPGHGTADAPAVATVAALTAAVLDGLDPGTPVDVVGVSLGGLVAQDLAIRHPGAVRRLVLVDTVATYPDPMRAMWHDRAALARAEGMDPLVDAMESTWFSDTFRAERPEVVATAREVFAATDPEGYARCCEALADADLRAGTERLTVPALVVCGAADAAPFLDAARWFARVIPDAGLHWIAGARHAAVLEAPEGFATVVREFLDAEEGR